MMCVASSGRRSRRTETQHPHIWFVRGDGSNVSEVVEDACAVLLTTGVAWIDEFSDLIRILRSRRTSLKMGRDGNHDHRHLGSRADSAVRTASDSSLTSRQRFRLSPLWLHCAHWRRRVTPLPPSESRDVVLVDDRCDCATRIIPRITLMAVPRRNAMPRGAVVRRAAMKVIERARRVRNDYCSTRGRGQQQEN